MGAATAVVVLVLVSVSGCTPDSGPGRASASTTARSASPSDSGRAGAPCPPGPGRIAPDPDRPRVILRFDVSADLGTVRGTEDVRFTPDLPISEVVFRLTANGPTAARQGTSVRVSRAEADGHAGGTYQRAGAAAGTQGGLLTLPLGRRVPAGHVVTARVEFTLTLGRGGFERFGHGRSVAWWGTGQPLLAWERGVGWHREPLLDFLGESATSETARLDLTVTAPTADTVLSSGTQDAPRPAGPGRRSWHAAAGTARDVSVAVGRLNTATAVDGGTRITVGAVDRHDLRRLADGVRSALDSLRVRFGPFPYPALNVTLLPFGGGGIEYPGSILLLGSDRTTVVHEVAHQWFYGMVGDSQARDPWLDEAFATYAEQLVDGRPTPSRNVLAASGRVDSPTVAFAGDERRYVRIVYGKGAAALRAARDAAGPARFDAAVRCYLDTEAWRIARPADLVRALAGLPRALAVLRRAGAV